MWILKFKPVNCKNCYKCVRNCPVKAIKIMNHQAQIIQDDCILCEKCTIVCPQQAKEEKNDIPSLERMMTEGRELVASVHPAYIAKYGIGSFSALKDALLSLGFSDVREESEGTVLVKREYESLLAEGQMDVMITSMCPSVVRLVKNHYPELIPYLLPVMSPAQAHVKYLREEYRECIPVYISPCVSAVADFWEKTNISGYVVSFEELEEWMKRRNIDVLERTEEEKPRFSRMRAVSGGISEIIKRNQEFKYLSIDGVENCIKVLEELKQGKIHKCFLELNACEGGCIGGPSFQKQESERVKASLAIMEAAYGEADAVSDDTILREMNLGRKFEEKEIYHQMPTEEELQEILKEMGKQNKQKELNCGACGYNTCRDKAVAIFQHKAEISMCIPYMREKEADYANKIINAMPGILVTVDKNLNVVQMNKAAADLFDIRRKKSIMGKPVSGLMDDYAFVNMLSYNKKLTHDQIFLEEFKVYLDRVLTYDKKNGLIICIMKNITKEVVREQEIKRNKITAAQMADKLADEQLRIVHQIAELLGETAADTKVAVEKLKETIMEEHEKSPKRIPGGGL